MSELVRHVFAFHGEQVRVVLIDGEPWFVLTDVAKILGYRDANHAGRILRDRDRRTHRMGTPNGVTVTVVSEAGLYRLIMRSNRPEAEAFQDWVTDDLLPNLRKDGRYEVRQLTHRELAQMVIDEADRADTAEAVVAEQGKELESARPKAAYVDAFVDPAEDVTTIGDFAQQLGLSEQALRDYLVKHGVIWRRVLGRRWSRSQGREIVEYQWRARKGYEGWFNSKDHPEVQKRLYNGQVPRTLYVNPVGKVRIREMLATQPIEEPASVTELPPRRRGKSKGGAA